MSMPCMQSWLSWYVCLFRACQAKGRQPEAAKTVRQMMISDGDAVLLCYICRICIL